MSSHTPTPWEIGPYPGHVQANTERLIAGCMGYQTNADDTHRDENEANAQHIVQCVNAHDDLVAALEAIVLRGPGQVVTENLWVEGGEALSKAREVTP